MNYFKHASDQTIMYAYNFQGNCSDDLNQECYIIGITVNFMDHHSYITDMSVMVTQECEYL